MEFNSDLIVLNEDCSHYFFSRAGQDLNEEIVESWVDQYAETQVKYLMLNPNAMRTSYASDVWDPIWKGYDPDECDDQPFFVGIQENTLELATHRKWVHTAWQLHQQGIDVYELWIDRARKKDISPWISMRMNDVHCTENEQHPIHSTFWRKNPELRRINWKLTSGMDRAFDYSRPEVREYHMKLICELVEKYDFDGLELDWMRHGYHFAPGSECNGVSILNQFTSDVRQLLDDWENKRGHKIGLAARVPSTPQKARALGMDAVTWARQGLIDMLTVTPFFATLDTDMPIELWKQLLDGTGVILSAGFEILLSPYPGYSVQNTDSIFRQQHTNSIETVRGAAASVLDRGADCIYLFNYMDSLTTMDDLHNYQQLLRDIGSLQSIEGKTRRHVVTYTDTWATGEPQCSALPTLCQENGWQEFRINIGPKPDSGNALLVLGIESGDISQESISVFVNGKIVALDGSIDLPMPHPDFSTYSFTVPLSTLSRGYNMVVMTSKNEMKIGWVEIIIHP